jgi:hypothetical protein
VREKKKDLGKNYNAKKWQVNFECAALSQW